MTVHSFYRTATRHPKMMVLLFVLLAAACVLCKPLIAINYDMNDYLPPNTASTLALDAMDAEYDGGVALRIHMTFDEPYSPAEIRRLIVRCAGTDMVLWENDTPTPEVETGESSAG